MPEIRTKFNRNASLNIFGLPNDFYKEITYNKDIIADLRITNFKETSFNTDSYIENCPFENRNLDKFKNDQVAYHQLILDIIAQQVLSTKLVIHNSPVKKSFCGRWFQQEFHL